MEKWLKENWEILSTIGAFVVGWVVKKYNLLRLKPKEKVEVQSMAQDIEAKRNKLTMDLLVAAEAQLSSP